MIEIRKIYEVRTIEQQPKSYIQPETRSKQVYAAIGGILQIVSIIPNQ